MHYALLLSILKMQPIQLTYFLPDIAMSLIGFQ